LSNWTLMRWLAPSRPAATAGTDQRGARANRRSDRTRLLKHRPAAPVAAVRPCLTAAARGACATFRPGRENGPPSRTRKRGCLTTRHRKCDRTTVGGGSSPSLASTRSSPIRPTRAGVHDHRIRCSRTNGLTVQDHRNPQPERPTPPRQWTRMFWPVSRRDRNR